MGDWDGEIADTIIAGDPNGGNVTIGDQIPPELAAWYLLHYHTSLSRAYIRLQVAPNRYDYMVVLGGSTGAVAFATGWVDLDQAPGAQVFEEHSTFYVPTATTDPHIQEHYGIITPMYITIGNKSALPTEVLSLLYLQNANLVVQWNDDRADFTINGISQPRGVVYFESVTASVASGAVAGTEYLLRTTANPVTFPNGRAFRLKFHGFFSSAAVQNPMFNVRVGGLAGTILLQNARNPIPFAGSSIGFQTESIIVNDTGAPVTITLALTIIPQVATLVNVGGAPGAAQAFWEIEDIGAANAPYSGVTV